MLDAKQQCPLIKPARMLVVLPNWVGDVVLAAPALRALRKGFADTHMTFLLKPYVNDILAGGAWADELVFWPGGKSRRARQRSFLGLVGELRKRRFDAAVLLTNSFRSGLLSSLIKAPRRIGYDRDGRGMLLTDRLKPHRVKGAYVPVSMVRYYGAVADYLGCRPEYDRLDLFTEPDDETAIDQLFDKHGVNGDRPVIVINSGAAFGSAKCYPPERFAAVADRLIEDFDAQVVVPCGPKELEIAHTIRHEMRRKAVFLTDPILPLRHLKALVRRADLLVTNDTGPRHFGCAFGTPTVTIFGPTDPAWTETGYAGERKLITDVDCGPCMKRRCATDHRCMTRISPDDVVAACAELLTNRPVDTTIAKESVGP